MVFGLAWWWSASSAVHLGNKQLNPTKFPCGSAAAPMWHLLHPTGEFWPPEVSFVPFPQSKSMGLRGSSWTCDITGTSSHEPIKVWIRLRNGVGATFAEPTWSQTWSTFLPAAVASQFCLLPPHMRAGESIVVISSNIWARTCLLMLFCKPPCTWIVLNK